MYYDVMDFAPYCPKMPFIGSGMALIYECNKTLYEKQSLRHGIEKSDKPNYLSIS